jgi:phosphoribosylformylglycinamidine synthase
MKVAVVVFPGTNCDRDTVAAVEALGGAAERVWHASQTALDAYDVVVLPGGFAHGDALRAGAIARFSPIMPRVIDFAAAGRPLLGICNGFQILLECGLLPGALLRNASLQFRSGWVYCRVEAAAPPFTAELRVGQVLRLPIAHGMGNYVPDERVGLGGDSVVALRYCDAEGRVTRAANPNGSSANIAGIARGNVFGLMPHPERAYSQLLGSTDGAAFLQSLMRSVAVAA